MSLGNVETFFIGSNDVRVSLGFIRRVSVDFSTRLTTDRVTSTFVFIVDYDFVVSHGLPRCLAVLRGIFSFSIVATLTIMVFRGIRIRLTFLSCVRNVTRGQDFRFPVIMLHVFNLCQRVVSVQGAIFNRACLVRERNLRIASSASRDALRRGDFLRLSGVVEGVYVRRLRRFLDVRRRQLIGLYLRSSSSSLNTGSSR